MEIYGGGTGASLVKGWSGIPISYATLVPMSTLDFVLGNRFWGERCLVLVDIEGAERWMLEGASNFLRRIPKPIWMMEITVNEHQPHGIAINPNLWVTFETFWNAGYEAWTANDSCRMVCRQEVESMASGGTDSLGTRNFLFIEQGEGAGVSEAHRDRMCRNTLINPNSSIAT